MCDAPWAWTRVDVWTPVAVTRVGMQVNTHTQGHSLADSALCCSEPGSATHREEMALDGSQMS